METADSNLDALQVVETGSPLAAAEPEHTLTARPPRVPPGFESTVRAGTPRPEISTRRVTRSLSKQRGARNRAERVPERSDLSFRRQTRADAPAYEFQRPTPGEGPSLFQSNVRQHNQPALGGRGNEHHGS
jgi:hypothetical protein